MIEKIFIFIFLIYVFFGIVIIDLEDYMKKTKQKLNLNRRNFLSGTATLASLAATA